MKREGEIFLVDIQITKTKKPRRFIIPSSLMNLVNKYMDLRVKIEKECRFFVRYEFGKCYSSNMGKNKVGSLAEESIIFAFG